MKAMGLISIVGLPGIYLRGLFRSKQLPRTKLVLEGAVSLTLCLSLCIQQSAEAVLHSVRQHGIILPDYVGEPAARRAFGQLG